MMFFMKCKQNRTLTLSHLKKLIEFFRIEFKAFKKPSWTRYDEQQFFDECGKVTCCFRRLLTSLKATERNAPHTKNSVINFIVSSSNFETSHLNEQFL